MTAICWAVRKNHLFLAGLKEFDIVCDHRPLIPLLNQKSLAQVENPRLLRLREKLVPYHFKAVWKSGKSHCIADALSRAPIDNPTAEDQEAEADVHHHLRNVAIASVEEIDDVESCHTPDLLIDELQTAARSDDEYQELAGIILNGFPDQEEADLPPSLRAYWQVKDNLSIDNGTILRGNASPRPTQSQTGRPPATPRRPSRYRAYEAPCSSVRLLARSQPAGPRDCHSVLSLPQISALTAERTDAERSRARPASSRRCQPISSRTRANPDWSSLTDSRDGPSPSPSTVNRLPESWSAT